MKNKKWSGNLCDELVLQTKWSVVTDFGSLQWHLFSKYQLDSSKLPPPTQKVFEQMILRAHYTALQWKCSHIPFPVIPDPEEFGWKWNEDGKHYEPIMTNILLLMNQSFN